MTFSDLGVGYLMLERQGHQGQMQLDSTESLSLACLLQEEEILQRRKQMVQTELTPFMMARAHVSLISTGPLFACSTSGWVPCSFTLWKLMGWICLTPDLAQRDTCSSTYSDAEVLA